MPYGTSRPILGDFFRLTYIENSGMAFGIDVGGKLFFSLFSLVASIAIIVYLYRVRTAPLGFRIALAMILGGAVGNLIDRMFYGVFFGYGPLFYGRVVDFFDVDFFDIDLFGYQLSRWPGVQCRRRLRHRRRHLCCCSSTSVADRKNAHTAPPAPADPPVAT